MATTVEETVDDTTTETVERKKLTQEERLYLESLPTKSDSFTFKVPKGHADTGKAVEKSFTFPVCVDNEDVLAKVMEIKGWSLVEMINDALKANARSNAYQLALAPYRPSQRTPEQIREDIIRDFVRTGIPEEAARRTVESMFAAANG